MPQGLPDSRCVYRLQYLLMNNKTGLDRLCFDMFLSLVSYSADDAASSPSPEVPAEVPEELLQLAARLGSEEAQASQSRYCFETSCKSG